MAITVDKKINESSTTCVYHAFDDTLGRDVLLKVLHRRLAPDEHVRNRFMREARACAALRSENIVQIYDLREHDGAPAIVMEYVAGRSLKDVIAEETSQRFALAEKVTVHVLRGLAVAHAQGIIHRDIKPGNILVSAGGAIKITDFGLAQISVAPTLTTEGTIVGTPAYMAPEIVRGEAADIRTDLFSLGATVAEILSGRQLFEGATYTECLNRISRFRPDMLDSLAEQSSPEFVAFLKKLMHPDRNRRYGSPREALAALGKMGSSEFLLSKPALPPRQRTGRLVAVATGVVLLILVGGYFTVKGTRVAPSDRADGTLAWRDTSIFESTIPVDSPKASIEASSQLDRSRTMALPALERRREASPRLPDSGSVILVSDPGVRVYVDSLFIGELPLGRPVRLAAGPHTVVFSHPLFEPVVQTVRLLPGKEITVDADFQARVAYLRCVSLPWAEVSVDDRYRDTTPMDRPIVLNAGRHRVRFHHPAFKDSVWDVTLAPRETLRVSVTFKP